MGANFFRDGVYPSVPPEVERNAAGSRKHSRVKLEPLWRARRRKASVGHCNVGLGAGAGQFLPTDAVGGASRKQAPIPSDLM